MTVEATTMYRARCDAPGCTALSSDYEDGNHRVYETVAELKKQFRDTVEGNLADDHNWLLVVETQPTPPFRRVEKHYCGKHTTWDDAFDKRVPALESADATDASGATDPSFAAEAINITESETA